MPSARLTTNIKYDILWSLLKEGKTIKVTIAKDVVYTLRRMLSKYKDNDKRFRRATKNGYMLQFNQQPSSTNVDMVDFTVTLIPKQLTLNDI